MIISLCCHNKIPQAGWFKNQNEFFFLLWRLQVHDGSVSFQVILFTVSSSDFLCTFMVLIIFIYLKGKSRQQRERDRSSICGITHQMPTTAKNETRWSHDSEIPSKPPVWAAENHSFATSSAASKETLIAWKQSSWHTNWHPNIWAWTHYAPATTPSFLFLQSNHNSYWLRLIPYDLLYLCYFKSPITKYKDIS